MDSRLPQPDWDKFNPKGTNPPVPPAPPRRRVPPAARRYSPYGQIQNSYGPSDQQQYNPSHEQGPEEVRFRGQQHFQRGRGRGRGNGSAPQYRNPRGRTGAQPMPMRDASATTPIGNANGGRGRRWENAGMKRQGFSGQDRTSGRRGRRSNFKNRKGKGDVEFCNEETPLVEGCVECGGEEAHYKCPKCFQKYCSVACCRTHKENSSCIAKDRKDESEPGQKQKDCKSRSDSDVQERRRVTYSFPTQDTIKPEGLMKLIQDDGLRNALKEMLKSSNLRSKIAVLDSSQDPKGLMNTYTDDVEFSKFRTFVVENLSNDLFK